MAIAFAEAGADVVCHASKAGGARETVEKIAALGRQTAEAAGDMSDKSVPSRLISEIVEKFGRIDILVNNAGTIRRSPAVDFTEEDWEFVLQVNLSSIFRLSQAAARKMIEQGGGKIVNIASLLSLPTNGRNTISTSTPSRRDILRPTIRRLCRRTKRAIGRF
jgi:2-deoxy-D-gluconate 3-dehydrogenase